MTSREQVADWVRDYERLWRTPGTDGLAGLFSDDATYLPGPWAAPIAGLPAIAAFWESDREGPDEEFTMSSEIVAVDGATAVVRVFVEYGGADRESWRDLWVLTLTEDRRCSAFEEWPFAPRQPDGH